MQKKNVGVFRWFSGVLLFAFACGCAGGEPEESESVASQTDAVNANPRIGDFAVYAQNSVALRDRVVVTGADVGARNVATGATLIAGFELSVSNDARVDTTQDVMANRVQLLDRANVGDVEARTVTNQFGHFSQQFPFPTMPALPALAAATAGTTNVTVAQSQTTPLNAGRFAALHVLSNGTLRLNGGVYQIASLTLDTDAKVEAAALTELRVTGRVSLADRARIGFAAGVVLNANALRIEVAGRNGTSGSLTDNPKSVAFATQNAVTALLLAPNGTIQVGQRAGVTGALAARDVFVDNDARVTFQSGFGPLVCVPANCDDANPCTTDVCNAGSCTHAPVATGTSCSDGNACNGSETCNATGTCAPGTPPTVDDGNVCTVDTCVPATGVVHTPVAAGTSCSDGNGCNGAETCSAAGVCQPGAPVICTAQDSCHAVGTCDVATGMCTNPPLPSCSVAHLATSVNGQPVSNPGGTTPLPADGTIQFTVTVPNGTPHVRYTLAKNLAFQSATAGAETNRCTPAVMDLPLPNGVDSAAQVLDCAWSSASTSLVVTALGSGTLAPRDDPFAAVACLAPAFTTCVPVRVALQLPAGTINTVGPQRTAIILASAPGAPPHPYANTVNTASIVYSSTNPGSARSFYLRSSYDPSGIGRMVLVGGNGGEGSASDVYGPFIVPANGCMDSSAVFAVVGNAIDYSKYERVVIAANDPTFCGGGGLTSIQTVMANGQPKVVTESIDYNGAFGDTTLNGRAGDIFLHEFGHQLGLDHGGGWECGSVSQAADGRCGDVPFLDPTDLMGVGPFADFSPQQKERLGWLEGGRSFPVWSSGRYVIHALEEGSENVKALKIPRKLRVPTLGNTGGVSSGSYYVAVRRPTAPFTDWLGFAPSFATGVALYMDEGALNDSTAFLDLTPASSAGTSDFFDGALLPGQAFNDALSGVSITLVSADATTATLDVVVTPRDTRYVEAGSSDPFGNPLPAARVDGTGNFLIGQSATLTAQPPSGYRFGIWLDSTGRFVSQENPLTLTVGDDTFFWAIFAAAAPTNDAFANAQPVTVIPSQVNEFTQAASIEAGEPTNVPCGSKSVNPQNTVWFSFTPAANQTIIIDTRGSDYFTSIAAFTGSSLGTLALVPNACSFEDQIQFAQVTLNATAGTTYFIQVGAAGLGQNLVVHFTPGP